MAELVRGELKFWKHTPNGLFEKRVRSLGEAALLAKILQDYDAKAGVSIPQHDGPPYGLKVLEESKKEENGGLGWQNWKDERNRSLHAMVRECGTEDEAYLVELGDPNSFQVTDTRRLAWFSEVINLVLTSEGLPEVLNVYRGGIAVPDRQILGAAGWRLDYMTKWEVSWYLTMTEALKRTM